MAAAQSILHHVPCCCSSRDWDRAPARPQPAWHVVQNGFGMHGGTRTAACWVGQRYASTSVPVPAAAALAAAWCMVQDGPHGWGHWSSMHSEAILHHALSFTGTWQHLCRSLCCCRCCPACGAECAMQLPQLVHTFRSVLCFGTLLVCCWVLGLGGSCTSEQLQQQGLERAPACPQPDWDWQNSQVISMWGCARRSQQVGCFANRNLLLGFWVQGGTCLQSMYEQELPAPNSPLVCMARDVSL